MIKRDIYLFNLDTGEALALGRCLSFSALDEVEMPDTDSFNALCISSLWHTNARDRIENDPNDVAQTMLSLSSFLIASRGQRLVVLDNLVLDTLDGEVDKVLKLSDFFGQHYFPSQHPDKKKYDEAITGFFQRRRDWLEDTLDTGKSDEGYFHRNVRKEYLELLRRKGVKYACDEMGDFHESDYDEIETLKDEY